MTTLRWFWRGFAATAVLIALATAAVTWAQNSLRSNAGLGPEGGTPPISAAEEALLARGYTSPLVISSADFTNDGNNGVGDYFFSFVGGYLEGSRSSGTSCLQAPVYVPNNATITEFFVSVYDNVTDGGMFLNLYRVNNYNASLSANLMGQISTGDAEASANILTENDPTIDFGGVSYPTYSYYMGVCLDNNVRLYSARVYYTE